MRTGGDDIAQAFALMGVRPIWALGSNRVVDFEVISSQLLGRPRVDVTLRVSGFFRDAFPNVMRLYDAAVQAVAALEEPGTSNTIQQYTETPAAVD
jgi:cobaltochelatase CobN